jgi:hypothetical protein
MCHVWGTGKVHTGFWGADLRERATWKNKAQMGDNIKIDFQGVVWGGMEWIDLAQDRDRWLEFVNAIMNLLVP